MKVITLVTNNIDFINFQYLSLKKHLKCDYEYIVFNDAKDYPDYTNFNDPTMKSKIENYCKENGFKVINIPNEQHKRIPNASDRCVQSLNFILKYQIENPDKYLFLDGDMFLFDDFNIKEYEKYDIAYLHQYRNIGGKDIEYIFSGIYYMNVPLLDLTNFKWDLMPGFDVGGHTQYWLNEYKDKLRIKIIEHNHSIINNDEMREILEKDERNLKCHFKYFCEIIDGCIIHYISGSNWRGEGKELHETITNRFKKFYSKY